MGKCISPNHIPIAYHSLSPRHVLTNYDLVSYGIIAPTNTLVANFAGDVSPYVDGTS